MSIEGGIVTGQVTASLDGLTRAHLRALREVVVEHLRTGNYDQTMVDIREGIDAATREWDAHDQLRAPDAQLPASGYSRESGLTPGGSCRER